MKIENQENLFTPDTMQEFLSSEYYKQALEQFKASKAPKKEWEIVAFRHARGSGHVYKLREDGKYRSDETPTGWGFTLEEMIKDEEIIHSVRRLSDGAIWSPDDKYKLTTESRVCTIKGFSLSDNGNVLRIHTEDGYMIADAPYWQGMIKLPAPILVTQDGKEIYEGDEFWGIRDWRVLEGGRADKYDKNLDKATPTFSTREAAEEWLTNNRPVLSLNDVKEWVEVTKRRNLAMDFILEKAAKTVKQKLNQ
jgi:hypothetical protein